MKPLYVKIDVFDARELVQFLERQYISHEHFPRIQGVYGLLVSLLAANAMGVDALNSGVSFGHSNALVNYRKRPAPDNSLQSFVGNSRIHWSVDHNANLNYVTRDEDNQSGKAVTNRQLQSESLRVRREIDERRINQAILRAEKGGKKKRTPVRKRNAKA